MESASLQASDAMAAAVQKTPNRVSLESMTAKIDDYQFDNPAICPTMTICVMRMKNGFIVVGKSAPADPANYNRAVGEKFAFEDCIRQIWPLEGYLLRERLAEQGEA